MAERRIHDRSCFLVSVRPLAHVLAAAATRGLTIWLFSVNVPVSRVFWWGGLVQRLVEFPLNQGGRVEHAGCCTRVRPAGACSTWLLGVGFRKPTARARSEAARKADDLGAGGRDHDCIYR
jgi:hypothetical protein